jgi:4-amino-4-deoxy-L-arabinose transferase-like glycosyltransferase
MIKSKSFEHLQIPMALSLVTFFLQILTSNHYGIFTDELYFIACGEHLQFGYVDHPPLAPLLTKISMLFSKSLVSLHFFPALAGAAVIILTALIARSLGGKHYATTLAAITIFAGPVFMINFGLMSVNPFDILFCTAAGYLVIKILQKPSIKLWIILGLVIGLGLNSKLTMITLAGSLAIGLALSKQRKLYMKPGIYICFGIAAVMFLPFVLWQINNNLPTLEFIRNVSQGKHVDLSFLQFIGKLAFILNPATLPLWLAGFYYIFTKPQKIPLTSLGIALIIFFIAYMTNNAKYIYVTPVAPILLAAGSAAIEKWTSFKPVHWIRVTVIVILSAFALMMLPLSVPLLPIDSFASLSEALSLAETTRLEKNAASKVPQYFADRFGCRELAETVASVYHSLPDSEQVKCGILGFHYADAGSVDFFGEELGLPKAIGRHNSYWLWGPKQYTGEIMLVIVNPPATPHPYFQSVEHAATFQYPYGEGMNRTKNIYLCRDSVKPLPELWPELKTYD